MSTTENIKKARAIFESWNPTAEQKLEQYINLFSEQYEKLQDSPRAKIKGLNEDDLLALGNTLQQQVMLKPMNEEVSFAQLGAMPTIALDFITAMFGKSVIPYIASEQTIDEIQGLVYFENIEARGMKKYSVNGTAIEESWEGKGYDAVTGDPLKSGDILGKAAGVPSVYPTGFAGEMNYGERVGTGNSVTTNFNFTLEHAPVRQNYVKIMCGGKVATDDGKGALIGNGVAGTINYETGEVTLNFLTAPINLTPIVANYATNFELGSLPTVTTRLDSKIVQAKVFGLQTDTSVISQYIMAKRHNFDMQERAVQILQEQILNEITNDLIMKIEASVENTTADLTQFDCTIPVGVSQQAHFNSADYAFGVVTKKMTQRAGKGTLTVGLAGAGACAFLEQMAKFKKVGEATAYATVYGIYDNRTIIIRCPQMTDEDAIYFLYKGETPFDAAAVYAPYMPLVGVADLPVPTAMLNRRSAVASMAALDVLVPGYIEKFKIVSVPAFNG